VDDSRLLTTSSVELHPLQMRREGTTWIVGRQETGEFVELPDEAVTLLRALQSGHSIAAAEQQVLSAHGSAVDALEFARTLVDLQFVAAVDGVSSETAEAPPSLTWLQPRHVSWVFSAPTYAIMAIFVSVSMILAARHGDLIPSYRAYFVTSWQGFNIAWNTALFVAAVGLHEFAHLAAARSERVHARIGLGTRLYMLCAQTTVPGLWGASRQARFRVYLAGMATDVLVISAALLAISTGHVTGFALRSLEALVLGLMLGIAGEFTLYMRTDAYFVLQELLRCKNLYADAWRYVGYLVQLARSRTGAAVRPADPLLDIPAAERRPVRVYAALMVLGTAASLMLFALYGMPIMVVLFARAFHEVFAGIKTASPVRVADGAAVLTVEGGLQVLFVRTFLARHGSRLSGAVSAVYERVRRARSVPTG
jgi:putative peptide zinc metalloprotease protein